MTSQLFLTASSIKYMVQCTNMAHWSTMNQISIIMDMFKKQKVQTVHSSSGHICFLVYSFVHSFPSWRLVLTCLARQPTGSAQTNQSNWLDLCIVQVLQVHKTSVHTQYKNMWWTETEVHVHTHTDTHIFTHTHAHKCTNIHTQTHRHTHTHKCTQIQMNRHIQTNSHHTKISNVPAAKQLNSENQSSMDRKQERKEKKVYIAVCNPFKFFIKEQHLYRAAWWRQYYSANLTLPEFLPWCHIIHIFYVNRKKGCNWYCFCSLSIQFGNALTQKLGTGTWTWAWVQMMSCRPLSSMKITPFNLCNLLCYRFALTDTLNKHTTVGSSTLCVQFPLSCLLEWGWYINLHANTKLVAFIN